VLSNVKPEEYRIDAWPRASIEAIAQSGGVGIKQSGKAAEYASVPLTVGGDDVDGLRVVTTAGHRLVAVVDELVDGEWAEPDYLETLRDQRQGPPR
jgi:hypothetical protein